ncbi:hypothetical protein LA080_001906 [Diaporthe eres]|nr:hypothetical protein LA080_001906 [Diaporthe eres]
MSETISPHKDNAEHSENPKDLIPDNLPLPDEIADLSAAEQAKLNRLVTRRLDLTLLPTVFILFLLNILSYYICITTSLWGVVSMSQGFTKNFAQLAAVRFILGLVEGKQSISNAVLLAFEHNANNSQPHFYRRSSSF